MCTIVFAWQVFDEAPLVLAANRDEASGSTQPHPASVAR